MKRIYLLSGSIILLLYFSCEKVDLTRQAKVISKDVSNVGIYNATAKAELIDEGEGNISEMGFVAGHTIDPDVLDRKYQVQGSLTAGTFSLQLNGLEPETKYYVRPYIIESGEPTYGSNLEFTTQAPAPSGGEWLHYDDGNNFDAIGFSEGGSFDIAIHFDASQLSDYVGYRLLKYHFFPMETTTTSYSVTLWEDTAFITWEDVPLVNAGVWNEYSLQYEYYITPGKGITAGIWIQDSPPGSFPAGVDEGPADKYYGDLISTDDGENWYSLATENPALDYNWNLQIYLADEKGKQLLLTSGKTKGKTKKKYPRGKKDTRTPSAGSMSLRDLNSSKH